MKDSYYNNIVLIGMPGSGKTTIGKLLSKRLSMGFVDLDKYIEKSTGMTIPEIFQFGEEYFRDLESQVVCEVSKIKKMVISTGGGVIKRPCNMEILMENGFIIFIDRPLEKIIGDIDTKSRPLLNEGIQKINTLYNERYNLYINYCHQKVDNIGSIEETVEALVNLIDK